MKAARNTKDIDLTMRGVFGTAHKKGESDKHAVLARLQDMPLETAEISSFTRSANQFLIWMPRRTEAPGIRWSHGSMAAFFVGFHVDVGIGDAVIEPVEIIKARNWLEFAGIDSCSVYMISSAKTLFRINASSFLRPQRGARVRSWITQRNIDQRGFWFIDFSISCGA